MAEALGFAFLGVALIVQALITWQAYARQLSTIQLIERWVLSGILSSVLVGCGLALLMPSHLWLHVAMVVVSVIGLVAGLRGARLALRAR